MLEMISTVLSFVLYAHHVNICLEIKGAESRNNVNKLFSKQQFCSIFDRPYHRDFILLF